MNNISWQCDELDELLQDARAELEALKAIERAARAVVITMRTTGDQRQWFGALTALGHVMDIRDGYGEERE